MSEIKVSNISNLNGDSGPVISGITTFYGSGYVKLPSGKEDQKVGISSGSIRYNENFNLIEFYDGTEWKYISESLTYSSSIGVFGGGYEDYYHIPSKNIDYISIASAGNATKFGDLSNRMAYASGCSSSTCGVTLGGYVPDYQSPYQYTNIMSYITFSTKGNSLPFAQLLERKHVGPGNSGCGSETRGLVPGGYGPVVGYTNTIEYITFASKANAIDFAGDLTVARYGTAAFSSPTRGVFASGWGPGGFNGTANVIDYVTIASTGVNASAFGTADQGGYGIGGCSSSTRGIWTGYQRTYYMYIAYVTIASTGSSQNFGEMKRDRIGVAACSSSTRGVFGGGYNSEYSGTESNTMEYVTIATTGNAQYFGDLTRKCNLHLSMSNNHGGL